jgi:two-component system, NtrC family, response regulator HydG
MSKILIIEDDEDILEIATAFFRQKDYQVTGFSNSGDALEQLLKGKITADVILTDMKMPYVSGLDILRECRATGIDTPVIVITSYRSMESALEAIQQGAYDYVVKPLNFPQLQISVERAIHFSRLKNDNATLRTVIQTKEGSNVDNIIGKSPRFLKALDLAKRVANSQATVLVTGESGTGKEVIARAIHNMSSRRKKPFVAINCSAIPENLLESELFGHAKGSFTGASEKKTGLFEEAEGGTLFLDEIGDMNVLLQAKLLRVLQDKKIRRVGENQPRPVDVRIISATHKDLTKEVEEGRFREDLYFRLKVIPIFIPPLRERKEDVVPLADFFLRKFSALEESSIDGFSKAAIEWLLQNKWKGNVRELENTIERAVVLCKTKQIELEDLQELDYDVSSSSGHEDFSASVFRKDEKLTMDALVKKYIQFTLEKNNGAKDKTAKELNIDRKTLYRKLQEIEKAANA